MKTFHKWKREPGTRLKGSRGLDSSKIQAPGVVAIPSGGYRLFYTAVGPLKPWPVCQGYILSAISQDGLNFRPEPGIRLSPQSQILHMSLRVISPSITRSVDGQWRMYFESRGSADQPTVICSAISWDMLNWEHEEGVRLRSRDGVGGPRFLPFPHGGGRLYCCESRYSSGGPGQGKRLSKSVVSAVTSDGLNFDLEAGYRLRDQNSEADNVGITAAEVVSPLVPGEHWVMIYSAWQDVPLGTIVPKHPSEEPNAAGNGLSEDFAVASIESDMAGYRSRIFLALSEDGLCWNRVACVIDGAGYVGKGLDAVHAEDMSLVQIGQGQWRMYYAACDRNGSWRIASAISGGEM